MLTTLKRTSKCFMCFLFVFFIVVLFKNETKNQLIGQIKTLPDLIVLGVTNQNIDLLLVVAVDHGVQRSRIVDVPLRIRSKPSEHQVKNTHHQEQS